MRPENENERQPHLQGDGSAKVAMESGIDGLVVESGLLSLRPVLLLTGREGERESSAACLIRYSPSVLSSPVCRGILPSLPRRSQFDNEFCELRATNTQSQGLVVGCQELSLNQLAHHVTVTVQRELALPPSDVTPNDFKYTDRLVYVYEEYTINIRTKRRNVRRPREFIVYHKTKWRPVP